MKRFAVLLLFVSLTSFAQNSIVDEAKTAITKKHHDELVEKAKTLLERKTRLEAALADTNLKLDKLTNGQDVKVGPEPDEPQSITSVGWSSSGGALVCCSTCYSHC